MAFFLRCDSALSRCRENLRQSRLGESDAISRNTARTCPRASTASAGRDARIGRPSTHSEDSERMWLRPAATISALRSTRSQSPRAPTAPVTTPSLWRQQHRVCSYLTLWMVSFHLLKCSIARMFDRNSSLWVCNCRLTTIENGRWHYGIDGAKLVLWGYKLIPTAPTSLNWKRVLCANYFWCTAMYHQADIRL